MKAASRLVCSGCGTRPARADPYPFSCPNARPGDGVDHVLRRELDYASVSFPARAEEPNPFVCYRQLLHPYQLARSNGISDAAFCGLVEELDAAVAAIDGRGFEVTPYARQDALSAALGFSSRGGVWVKDETGNVAGSHKARHLFDVVVQIEVAQRLGLTGPDADRPLAIASCGNAALAAAVVAAAARRRLIVFVPVDADPGIVERLIELGADVNACARDGMHGDPTYRRLLAEIAAGALPFTCQGNLNGIAVEGGMTLGYELVSAGARPDRLIVQVGGGALASACYESLSDARALGVLDALPRIDTVQTESAWPLRRAYDALLADHDGADLAATLRAAASRRASYMRPWETEPHSIASGILDDETYDWLAVCEAMLATGGSALVVGERTLADANALARKTTPIRVDPTGSAGLAGLLSLRAAGEVADDERVAVLFTGLDRATHSTTDERIRHEELPRQGHSVTQGL